MRSLIVIPTYNEEQNIITLIDKTISYMPESTILVIDDSKDSTFELLQKNKRKKLEIIKRSKKMGRGSAVLKGFEWGIKNGHFDYFFEMDADFSHDPVVLPEMLEKLKEGNDLVLGSRYTANSKIVNWGAKRTFFSKMANLFAQFLLDTSINDYTNGLRGYRKKLVDEFLKSKINSNGYIVLSEIAYFNFLRKGTCSMLPITFINRKRGESNLTFKEIISAF